jgi:hypothetical protein
MLPIILFSGDDTENNSKYSLRAKRKILPPLKEAGRTFEG